MRVPLKHHLGRICDMKPGTWYASHLKGRKIAQVCCLKCERVFMLHDLQIAPDGAVLGHAVFCPWPSCTWQVWATLRGWEP